MADIHYDKHDDYREAAKHILDAHGLLTIADVYAHAHVQTMSSNRGAFVEVILWVSETALQQGRGD